MRVYWRRIYDTGEYRASGRSLPIFDCSSRKCIEIGEVGLIIGDIHHVREVG